MKQIRIAATLACTLGVALAGTSAHAQVAAGQATSGQAASAPATPAAPDAGGMQPGGKHGAMQSRGGPRDGGRMHDGHGMMMPGMESHMLMRMADELGLSPEQRQTIRGFFESAQPGFRKLREQMRANTKLVMDTQPDDAKYQSVVQQVSRSSAELAEQMVLQSSQLRTQVYGVLTAEQKTKLKAKQAEMQARWAERRERREAARQEGGAKAAAPLAPAR